MKAKRSIQSWLTGSFVALAFASVTTLNAVPINGSISFNGTYDLTGTALSFQSAMVSNGTQSGAYTSALDGLAVSFATFDYTSASTLTPLWTFTDASTSTTYGFDADSVNVAAGSTYPYLHLFGTGSAYINGGGTSYDKTSGSWEISILPPGQGTKFSFVASSTAIPDGGSTVLLLGAALSAFGLLRKKFA